jgi:hypothetical protein
MSVIARRLHDRFGNTCFQYANARAYAERHGCELHTTPWVGDKIFDLDSKPLTDGDANLPKRADLDIRQWDGETNIEITGWCLNQDSLIYSRADLRRWLKFKPEVMAAMDKVPRVPIACHLRHGDFLGLEGFVAISRASYVRAVQQAHLDPKDITWVSEETAHHVPELDEAGIGFMADFAVMMWADVLFRANSSYSWWASSLGLNRATFSPDLAGIATGQAVPQEVPFVAGNHCAISRFHPNCSDLHLRET